MTPMPILFAAFAGLLVGSFLNVVALRMPRGVSFVSGSSHCMSCENPVKPWDNIPLFSWLLLRGRCRSCGTGIAARYPLVEAGTAVLFAAVAARFGWSWELPAYLYLAAVAISLAMIDLDVLRLPNKIVIPSYGVAAALLVPVSLTSGDPADLLRGLVAAGLMYLLYRVLAIWGMGGGDVKLAPLLGFYLGWLGWSAVMVGAFAGFLLGGLVGGVLMALRLADRKSRIPFGPYMLAGAFLAVFAAAPLADWYTTLLLPTA
jgi:leader peptidase (prepilin peptidase)/N-methyltransferase